MWKLPLHTRAFLQSLSAYAGMFFVRDTITASSSHLSKLGYFSPEHYSLFVSCNYACQALSRVGAGILIDWTNEPKFIYIVTAGIAIVSIFADSLLIPGQHETVVLMGLSYVAIKTACSFSRNCLMKILSKFFQNKDFGTVNNVLSGSGALANAGSMILMTVLFRNEWKWSSICYLISGVVLALNIPVGFIHREPKRIHQVSKRKASQSNNMSYRRLPDFFHKPSFYILMLLSMAISVVRINTSFMSWYLVVMLSQQSEDCPAIASILFGLSILAIFCGALFNQLPSRYHNMVTFATSLLSWASLSTLYYIHLHDVSPSFYYCMVLMGCNSFMSTPINCLCDGLYAHEISSRETQSTVIGLSSGFGYLSAAVTAFLIKDQITSREGWLNIFRCQISAGAILMTLLLIYIFLRPTKAK